MCPSTNFYGTCLNGGHCFNSSCCCPVGFTGTVCNSNIIECISDPCMNGGTCIDGIGHYNCSCIAGMYIN